MKQFKKFLEKNGLQMLGVILAFGVAGVLINTKVIDFQTNVLTDKKSAPFDGTVTPVKKVPNWVALSPTEWKNSYDQIPLDKFIDLPLYQPSQLSIPFASLNFGKDSDKAIRNAQVTFSTPYMGDYKLDGLEYAGSHLAVDIKVPAGTPIYSIANGVVIKAASEPSGFGNNVVVRHDDVPSFNDANTKTTYFSGYGHMTNYVVSVGDLVSKGQIIGYSGSTGTATTPHVHFQIDNDQAPWHIYWPFTSKEASDAGVDFFGAVNIGLGKEKALATTISPMAYVQKYLSYDGGGAANNVVAQPIPPIVNNVPVVNNSVPDNYKVVATPVNNNSPVDQLPPDNAVPVANSLPANVAVQPPLDVKPAVPELSSLQLKYNSSFVLGAAQTVKVIALDKDNQIIKDYKPANELSLKVENGSATLDKTYLTASDFVDGIAQFNFTPLAQFGVKLSVTADSVSSSTNVIQEGSFSDVSANSDSYVAINFLKDNNVVRGYSDGSFKPDSNVSRVESLKFIFEGLNKPVNTRNVLEFADTDSKAWYARYIAAAQKLGIVKGYPGNVFKPANQVSKAEFLKVLLGAAGYGIDNYHPSVKPFDDVDISAWYGGYVASAKDRNLLDTSTNVYKPNSPITRAEVADLLYKTIMLKVGGVQRYNQSLVVSANDVASFYREI